MKNGAVLVHVWRKLSHIFARILCVLVIAAQGWILNYYMAHTYGAIWWAWTVADVFVIAVFIIAFIVSYQYLKTGRNHTVVRDGALPLGYVAWIVYSIFLVVKIIIIFQTIAETLVEEDFFGPNTLKFALALAAVVYLLLLTTHHETEPDCDRKAYIYSITGSVVGDIFDSIEILNVLFISESRIMPTFELHKCILAFSCFNLMLPALPLVVLSKSRFGRGSLSDKVKVMHKFLYLVAVNIPFLIIRMVLWHVQNVNVSVFLTKNLVMVGHAFHGVYDNCSRLASQEKGEHKGPNDKDSHDGEHIELQEHPAGSEPV